MAYVGQPRVSARHQLPVGVAMPAPDDTVEVQFMWEEVAERYSGAVLEIHCGLRNAQFRVRFSADGTVRCITPGQNRYRTLQCTGAIGTSETGGKANNVEIECTIYFDTPKVGDKVCTLQCGHTYCDPCIRDWWAHADAKSCPSCRR